MSAEINKMTDKEIAQWQEELYELELDCSTRPSITKAWVTADEVARWQSRGSKLSF